MQIYDVLKVQASSAVPFARYLGLEVTQVGPGEGTARLTHREELSNHVGTMHAGSLFTLGEAASGAAMLGIFAEQLAGLRPVAANARINFLRNGRGALEARATCREKPESLRDRLAASGQVQFDVEVEIRDGSAKPVALMTVAWDVRPI